VTWPELLLPVSAVNDQACDAADVVALTVLTDSWSGPAPPLHVCYPQYSNPLLLIYEIARFNWGRCHTKNELHLKNMKQFALKMSAFLENVFLDE
jgi:hypothetical protein